MSTGWCLTKLNGPKLDFTLKPLTLSATYPDRKVYIVRQTHKKTKPNKHHRIE